MSLSNHEIVVVAVYLLQENTMPVDVEDVAVKANEIAPGRFTWRKYPSQINLEAVRKRLWDAAKAEKGAYVIGTDRKGWTLTPNGIAFAERHIGSLEGKGLTRRAMNQRERTWYLHEKARLLATDAFMKLQVGEGDSISPSEVDAFFRIDDYVTGVARKRKVARILTTFADDPDLGPTVLDMASRLPPAERGSDGR